SKHSTDICALPMKKGYCPKKHKRFYYDSKSQQCLEFTYSGCGGNKNRFHTTEDCERACKKQSNAKTSQTTVSLQTTTRIVQVTKSLKKRTG
ncbi:unnamed protein product, partial [Heterobilharzia americana]